MSGEKYPFSSGVVPSRPIVEDTAEWQSKRSKAFRLLIVGLFLVVCGIVIFWFSPTKEIQETLLSDQSLVALIVGFLGIIVTIVGLSMIPKVKIPPETIIR